MLERSPEVIESPAALARSAMLRTERLDDLDGGGTLSATCCGAGLALSAAFASTGLISAGLASATLTGAGFDTSASFGAAGGGAALAALEATLSGAAAAKRALN